MKCLSSFQELDALGEALSKDYTKKAYKREKMYFDIEGFITDYLGLIIVYESYAEDDASKIGFLANGVDPLIVYRKGKPTPIVFPKNTVVIERFLLRREENSRRRFTLAHEAAHMILEKHIPTQTAACFHTDYDKEAAYAPKDLQRIFSLNEALANRLGAAILMPLFLVANALKKHNDGNPLLVYDGGIFAEKDKLKAQRMANDLGVSFSAFINRLKELRLLDCHPIEEYIENGLQFGGHYDK